MYNFYRNVIFILFGIRTMCVCIHFLSFVHAALDIIVKKKILLLEANEHDGTKLLDDIVASVLS